MQLQYQFGIRLQTIAVPGSSVFARAIPGRKLTLNGTHFDIFKIWDSLNINVITLFEVFFVTPQAKPSKKAS